MNKLEKLALEHVINLADELDSESISLGITLGLNKENFNAEKHTYPLAGKARRIVYWAEAILENSEK